MSVRDYLKSLALQNPLGEALFRWKFERHLTQVLLNNGIDCEVYPTKKRGCYALRKGQNVIILSLKDALHGNMVGDLFDSLFAATVPYEENGLRFVDYSGPKLHTLPNGLQFEFPSFPEESESFDQYTTWYTPKPGELVFDLGANAGISTCQFAKLVGPTGRVVCFEPDQVTLPYLRRNIARHNLDNVTLVEAAIGGEDGTADFYSEGRNDQFRAGPRAWQETGWTSHQGTGRRLKDGVCPVWCANSLQNRY
jgi:hypothetical protein